MARPKTSGKRLSDDVLVPIQTRVSRDEAAVVELLRSSLSADAREPISAASVMRRVLRDYIETNGIARAALSALHSGESGRKRRAVVNGGAK
jgi:hypothetical protein